MFSVIINYKHALLRSHFCSPTVLFLGWKTGRRFCRVSGQVWLQESGVAGFETRVVVAVVRGCSSNVASQPACMSCGEGRDKSLFMECFGASQSVSQGISLGPLVALPPCFVLQIMVCPAFLGIMVPNLVPFNIGLICVVQAWLPTLTH